MKIGVIAACPFLDDRGTPLRIYGICQGLAKLGHQVEVCTYHLGRDPNHESINIHRMYSLPIYQKKKAGPDPLKPMVDLILYVKAFEIFHTSPPDFIIGSHIEGGIISAFLKKTLGIPYLYDAHAQFGTEMQAFGYIPERKWARVPFDGMETYVVRTADGIGVVSEELKIRLREFSIQNPNLRILPNGVNLDDFTQVKNMRSNLNIPDDKFLVTYVGNLSPYQGIDLLLEAATSLGSEIHFLIVGGPEDEYIGKAKNEGVYDKFTFTGKVPHTDVPDYLATSDCLIAPRLGSKTEGQQASKLIHYLASGKSIIATDIAPHLILDDNQTAILIPDDSSNSICEAINTLKNNPSKRKKLEKNARTEAKKYEWKNSAKILIELFEQTQ